MKTIVYGSQLSCVMFLGALPVTAVTANAETSSYEVDTWEELSEALTAQGTATITVTDDITYRIGSSDESYEESRRHPNIKIAGTKTLDLNGHEIVCDDQSNDYVWGTELTLDEYYVYRTLFSIPKGTSLTIDDSSSDKGKIQYKAFFQDVHEADSGGRYVTAYDFNVKRDIFDVEGTLTVNGGQIVAGDEWYGPAVLWAAENGIVTGYQDGNFGPADMITREQMALMMYRYAKSLGKDVSNLADISSFTDASSVSEFAVDAIRWANGMGIITGKDNGTRIDPQGYTVRAEAAAIIQRYMVTYAQ